MNKGFIRKNLAIWLAFLLPMALIVAVALSVYLPGALLNTDYNFIYATCDAGIERYSYGCNTYLQQRYGVKNGQLFLNEVDPNQDLNGDGILDVKADNGPVYKGRIFLHNTDSNESKEISVEEAQTLKLNSLLTSDDGVTISNDYTRGGGGGLLLPYNSSSYGYYLTKGDKKSRLNLINDTDNYYDRGRDNFHFLGWVLPGRNQ